MKPEISTLTYGLALVAAVGVAARAGLSGQAARQVDTLELTDSTGDCKAHLRLKDGCLVFDVVDKDAVQTVQARLGTFSDNRRGLMIDSVGGSGAIFLGHHDSKSGPSCELYYPDGTRGLVIAMGHDAPSVTLSNAKGTTQLFLGTNQSKGTKLVLCNGNGASACGALVDTEGTAGFSVMTEKGDSEAIRMVRQNDDARDFSIFNDHDKRVALLGLDPSGAPSMHLMRDGSPAVLMAADPNGGAALQFFGDHDVIVGGLTKRSEGLLLQLGNAAGELVFRAP